MIHMNVFLLSDAEIMAIYGKIFSQKQFYGIHGPGDESQGNCLSNDHQQFN